MTLAPNPVAENAGTGAVTGTITRNNMDTSQALTVNLTSSDPAHATVASSVTIAAGAASGTFSVNPVDDNIADGAHTVNVTGFAPSPVAPGLDSTFGSGGYSSVPSLWEHTSADFPAVKVQPDGKVVAVAGAELNGSGSSASGNGWAISRTLSNGTLDSTFGTNGIVHTAFPGEGSAFGDGANALAFQPDGKIVVVGIIGGVTGDNYEDWGIARYNTNGTLDNTFGTGGLVRVSFPGETGWANGVALLPNGDILVAGSGDGFTVARLTSTGQLDTSFGSSGISYVAGASGTAEAMSVQPDGKIVLTGNSNSAGLTVARLNADGTLDTTFNSSGLAVIPLADFGSSYTYVEGMGVALQADGKIVVAGTATSNSSDGDWVTARLNPDGSLDTSFNHTGVGALNFAGYQGRANDVTVQADGKIVLAGYADVGGSAQFNGQGYNLALARYNSDGSLDASFHDTAFNRPGKYVFSGLPSIFEEIWGIDLQSDGKLAAVVGYYDQLEVARFDLGLLAASNALSVTNTDAGPPTAVNDAYTAIENSTLTASASGVLANDTAVNSTPLSAVLVSGPIHGTLALNADGSFSYTPANGFVGTDSFTYDDTEGSLTSNIATVTISVRAPVAVDDRYGVSENTLLSAFPGVLANDTAVNLTPLSAVLISGPSHGSLTLNANGSFTYTPAAGFLGTDSFTYDDTEGTAVSNTATVTLTVAAPVANNDAYSVTENTTLTIVTPGVLANDTAASSTTLTATLISGPSNGTLSLNANGSFTYTPATGFVGTDSFTYDDSEGSAVSNVATVNITVNAAPNPSLTLTLSPNPVPEDAGTGAVTGSITRNNMDTSQSLTISLTNSDPAHATVAASVTIPAGATSANFSVSPIDDNVIDGTHTVNISGFAPSPVAPGLDPLFGSGGYTSVPTLSAPTSADFPAVKAQPDGKIVAVAGSTVSGSNWAISRTLPDGTPDSSFGSNGIVETTFPNAVEGTSDGANALAFQPDGKIVVAGIVANGWGIARYNTNGTLDTTFGSGGLVQVTFPGYTGWANAVTVLSNGQILVAGFESGFTVGRFNSNGQLDTTFGSGGFAHVTFDPNGQYGNAEAMAVQSDGKIVLTGSGTGTALPVARLNANGSADTSFSGSGVAFIPVSTFGQGFNNVTGMGLALQSDGKIVVAGTVTSSNSDGDWVTVRLTSSGTLDSGFNSNGVSVLNFSGYLGRANDVTIQPDGKIVVAGYANVGGSTQFNGQGYNLALARYNTDGTLDASFHDSAFNSPGEYVFNGLPSVFEEIWGVDMQPSGKLAAIVGYYNTLEVASIDTGLLAATDPLSVTNTDGAVPTAANDSYSVNENSVLQVASPGVLGNDTAVDFTPMAAVLVSGPSHGTLTLNSNGSFSYTPNAGFYGTDSFTYHDTEGSRVSNTATVTLTVNRVPVAVDDNYTTNENVPLVLSNPGTDSLTMVSQPGDYVGGGQTYSFTSATGTFTATPSNHDNQLVFYYQGNVSTEWWYVEFAAPNGGPLVAGTYNNAARLPFQAASQPGLDVSGDGRGSNTLTGSFVVKQALYDSAGNIVSFDAAFVQYGDNSTAALTGEIKYSAPSALSGVLGNDSPANGTLLSAALVSSPSNGTVSLNADGTFTYTPNAYFHGTDSFTYQDTEGNLTSNIATANITVNFVNQAPSFTAGPDQSIAEGSGAQTVTNWATHVSNGPGDESDETLAFLVSTSDDALFAAKPAIDAATGTLTYTPAAGAVGSATVTVALHDSGGTANGGVDTSPPQSFAITINNVAPSVSLGGNVTINEGDTLTSSGSFSDPGVETWTATVDYGDGAGPQPLSLNADKSFDLSHTYAEDGSYTVTVAVADSNNGVGTSSFTVTVKEVVPTATLSNSGPVNEGQPATVSFANAFSPSQADTVAGFHYAFSLDESSLTSSFTTAGTATSAQFTFSESGTYTVWGRILDSDGAWKDYPTQIIVNDVAPTATLANNGPVNEGHAATVSFANAFSPSQVDSAAGFHYAFSLDESTLTTSFTMAGTGSSAAFTFSEKGTYTVWGRILASDNAYSDYPTTITVNDVAPTAALSNSGPVNECQAATVSFANAFSPSQVDTAAGFHYAFSLDESSLTTSFTAAGTATSAQFTFSEKGTYMVWGRILASDNAYSDYPTTITVNDVAPTAALSNSGPVNEGQAATVSFANAFSPSQADTAAGFHYAFSLDESTLTTSFTTAGTATSAQFTFSENGTHIVWARILASDNAYSDYPTTITVNDVAPTAALSNNGPVIEGQAATVSFANAFSPSQVDTAAGFHYAFSVDESGLTTDYSTASTVSSAPFTFTAQGSYTVWGRILASDNAYSDYSTKITVSEAPPTASVSGPTTAVPGQPPIFTFAASDPEPVGQTFTYVIDWGDGSAKQTVSGTSPIQETHIFTATGRYTVAVTATDGDGGTSAPGSFAVSVPAAAEEGSDLFVGGTTGNDTIVVAPSDLNGDLKVTVNGSSFGPFHPTGDVVVFAQAGDDHVQLASASIQGHTAYVAVRGVLFGESGNNILDARGSSANDILVGGPGNDTLYGGRGRNLLIGGAGSDTLNAGSGGDILIAGTTNFDFNRTALDAIMDEWGRTDIGYQARINDLMGTTSGGLNGSYFLNASTVHDDGAVDHLNGGAGQDWYFYHPGSDVLKNKKGNETATAI